MLRPILLMVSLGALLFGGVQSWRSLSLTNADAERTPVRITAGDIDRLRSEWIDTYAGPPNDRELRVLIERAINDQILHLEALALQLHRADPVVRMRLVQNMQFLGAGDTERGTGLYERAVDLGMERNDIVVRRRLIERMTAVIGATVSEPSVEECRTYVELHPEQFTSSSKYRLVYVFEDAAGTQPVRRGLFGAKKLKRSFGADTAEELAGLALGVWHGPFARDRGHYRIRIDEILPGEPMPFDLVKERARLALLRERRAQAVTETLREMRSRYDIEVAEVIARASEPS